MPAWMEILLNVIGYAGFIGIAKYHKPSGPKPEAEDIEVSQPAARSVSSRLCGSPSGPHQPMSALTSTCPLSGCGRSEKLTTTNVRQNSRPTTITRRWVGCVGVVGTKGPWLFSCKPSLRQPPTRTTRIGF